MGLSKLEICNEALRECPHEPIADFKENGLAGPLCADRFQQAFETLLAMHSWKLPVARVALASVANDRAEWAYAYALPADGISEVRLIPGNPTPAAGPGVLGPTMAFSVAGMLASVGYPYQIAGRKLYTNLPGAVLEYADAAANVHLFGPLFVRALVLELAARLVFPLLRDAKREADLIRKAEVARDRAIAAERYRDPSEATYPIFANESELARQGIGLGDGTIDGLGLAWTTR